MSLLLNNGRGGTFAVAAVPNMYSPNLAAYGVSTAGPSLASVGSGGAAGGGAQILALQPEPASAGWMNNTFSVVAVSITKESDQFTAATVGRALAQQQAARQAGGFVNNGTVAAGPFNVGNGQGYNVVSSLAQTMPQTPLDFYMSGQGMGTALSAPQQYYNPTALGSFARVAGTGLLDSVPSSTYFQGRGGAGCGCARF